MESCQVSSALDPKLHEYVPKEPNFELEFFWRVIKGLPPFSSAPNRWQMWRSLVTWGLSCRAGKPALTFYKISRTAFSSNLAPLIGKKEGGTKRCLIQHEKTSTTLRHWTEINKRISLGFHFDFGRGWASVFILSSRSVLFVTLTHWLGLKDKMMHMDFKTNRPTPKSQQAHIHLICCLLVLKIFVVQCQVKGLSFLLCFTNPSRLICYGLNK